MIPTDFAGTLPGWITAVSTSTGVVTLITMYWRRGIAIRKLGIEKAIADNVDAADIRDHYADEVQKLRDRLDKQAESFRGRLDEIDGHYRDIISKLEQRYTEASKAAQIRHEECMADRDKLRNEVSILRNEINGLVRVITQASIDRVIALGDDVSDEIKEAAARAQAYIAEEGKKG